MPMQLFKFIQLLQFLITDLMITLQSKNSWQSKNFDCHVSLISSHLEWLSNNFFLNSYSILELFSVFFVYLGATPNSTQGPLVALCSGITWQALEDHRGAWDQTQVRCMQEKQSICCTSPLAFEVNHLCHVLKRYLHVDQVWVFCFDKNDCHVFSIANEVLVELC